MHLHKINPKSFQLEGLGTVWYFRFYDKKINIQEIQNLVWQEITKFDKKYSRFNPQSVISQLNQDKFLEISDFDLVKMLEIGQKISLITFGEYSLSKGQELEALGYGQAVAKPKELSQQKLRNLAVTLEGFKKIKADFDNFGFSLSLDKKRVFLKNNKKLDLGSLGKGYLVDKIVKKLRDLKLKEFVINAGGDVFTTALEEFYLENPNNIEQYIGKIKIQNLAIASSNNTKRKWKDKTDKQQAHLLTSASDLVGVFTQAKSTFIADLAATAVFVSRPECLKQLKDFLGFEFMLIFRNGKYLKSRGYLGKLNKLSKTDFV